ncbi:DUF5017 domain-containing protein [Niabella aquatica]
MNKVLSVLFVLMIFISCAKRDEVKMPDDFEVFADKQTYKVGDTISFNFSGNPDHIVFWSGADGNNYDYRTRTEIEGNSLVLNFKSFSQLGQVDKDNIKLLVSNDFSGVYDSANVRSATWLDVTNKAVWSSGADQTPSGDIVLDEFAEGNKNIVIAFRYVTNVVKPLTLQNRWVIRSFDLNSINQAGKTIPLLNMATAGWKRFSFAGVATTWEIYSAQLISQRNDVELDDDWILTKQIRPNAVDPDRGAAIKTITGSMPDFKTTYSKPGVYKVVFEATNAGLKESKRVLRELMLTIQP